MALEMQARFLPLRTMWAKRGYDLDLGIGLTQGYATLGAIGFEGRWDYACIGSVSNMASRLCSEAQGGQVLTNRKTPGAHRRGRGRRGARRTQPQGHRAPTPVFNITALRDQLLSAAVQ